ncbi:MAG: glycoside hydrolase family 78 protein [Planctomycetota bacterium]
MMHHRTISYPAFCRLVRILAIIAVVGLPAAGADSATSRANAPQNLRCEYLANPVGIGTVSPRLSWRLAAGERGYRQSAYRVIVAGDEAASPGIPAISGIRARSKAPGLRRSSTREKPSKRGKSATGRS